MKASRWWLIILSAIPLTFGVALAACDKQEDIAEGPETGVYYFGDNEEYLLMLNGGNNFTLVQGEVNASGTYQMDGEAISFIFYNAEAGEASGYWNNDVLTFTYGDSQFRFLRRIAYTVSFDSNGGSEVVQASVINGKTVDKPADPARDGYGFIGWYTDNNTFKQPYTFGSAVVTSDTTLYAYWGEKNEGEAEYTVTFDLGGGETLASMETIGGKLYNVPTPAREGSVFKGWWISAEEDAEKLSYVYAEDTVFKADTTLFALWQDEGVAVAPVFSVGGVGITWEKLSSSATLNVTGPVGFSSIKNVQIGATASNFYALDFAQLPAGKYTVSMTSGGQTTTRYYYNKALDRVPHFVVVGNSVLVFDPVENAERYFITIECGNPDHAHTMLDNGYSTNYNFANCEMSQNGIAFTVTATATGFASSTSVFTYAPRLDEVTGLRYDAEKDALVWNSVSGAMNYTVSINGAAPVDVGNQTSYGLKTLTGEIAVELTAKTKGYISSSASLTFTKENPAAPKNVTLKENTLVWSAVQGATGYTVRIGGKEYNVVAEDENADVPTSFDLTSSEIEWIDGTDYTIAVKATVNGKDSVYSDSIDARYLALSKTVAYSKGVLSWQPVIGAQSYTVFVNGELQATLTNGETSVAVRLGRAGINTVSVSWNGAAEGEAATVEVYAYQIEFDSRGGTAVEPVYYAVGDAVDLPRTAMLSGYDFADWYNSPGGAEGNGAKYNDAYFTGNSSVVLYAYYTPKEFTVNLEYGVEGTGPATATVKYNRDYVIDPPVMNADSGKMFLGWYGAADGGVPYTDEFGNSLSAWKHISNEITLYAYYIDSLEFIEDGDGYSVRKGNKISQVANLVIPSEYNGKPVVSIAEYGFQNCSFLTVTIPSSVHFIADTAFDGCNKLVAFYTPGCDETSDYYAVDGSLIWNNPTTGAVELAFVPKMAAGEAGHYIVPSGVTKIGSGVFYRRRAITSVTIPVTVECIEKDAFYYDSGYSCTIETIEFEPAAGRPVNDLLVSVDAFNMYWQQNVLKKLVLCERLVFVDENGKRADSAVPEMLAKFKNLQTIEVEETGHNRYYSSVDGMLCNGAGNTLIYCPIAKSGVLKLSPLITAIGDNAFNVFGLWSTASDPDSTSYVPKASHLHHITEIIIHSGVKSIGASAFLNDRTLVSVVFEASRNPANLVIGERAFYGCVKLRSIVFEETGVYDSTGNFIADKSCGVVEIGEEAFAKCVETELVLPSTLRSIANNAFDSNTKLVKLDLSHTGTYLEYGDQAFGSCSELEEVTLTSNVGYIRFNSVFYNCTKLSSFTVNPNNPNYFIDDNGVVYNKNKTEITYVPESLEGEFTVLDSVVSISGAILKDNKKITSLRIPASVTYIGVSAFEGCTGLETVTFDQGAGDPLVIDEKAFYNCINLTDIELPSRTKSLGESCFGKNTGTSRLQTVTLKEGLESIGARAFSSLVYLANINIPSTVTEIGEYAFSNDSRLTQVTFSNRALESGSYRPLTLGDSIFRTTALTSIELPEGLKYIPKDAFNSCQSLQTVVIPTTVANDYSEGLRAIGEQAFWGCKQLQTVTFTPGGTDALSIGYKAFYNCISLTGTFKLPARISGFASALDVFELGGGSLDPANVTSVFGDYSTLYSLARTYVTPVSAFEVEDVEGTNGDWFAFDGALYRKTGDGAVLAFCAPNKTGVLTVSKLASTFRPCAFYGCAFITAIEFEEPEATEGVPAFHLDSLSSKGYTGATESMFVACRALERIAFPARLTSLGDHVLAVVTGTSTTVDGVTVYPLATHLKDITFADGCKLTSIGTAAFQDAEITSIVLPSGVTDIGTGAFSGCASLTSVTISDKITQASFSNLLTSCTALIDLIVPDTCETFSMRDGIVYNKEQTVLMYCSPTISEESITIPQGIAEIPANAFKDVKTIGAVIFEPGDTPLAIGNYAFSGMNITTVQLPKRLTSMGESVFRSCTQLVSVTFEDGYNYANIPAYTFYGCTKLGDDASFPAFSVPDCVSLIGNSAFYNCSKLKAITFSANSELNTVVQSAFYNCKALTSIKLPSRVQYLGAVYSNNKPTLTEATATNVFYGCTALKSVDLSDCVDITMIGQAMFSGCTQLQTVQLNAKIKTIAKNAFLNCKALTAINTPNVESIGDSAFNGCLLLATIDTSKVKTFGVNAFSNGSKSTGTVQNSLTQLKSIDLSSATSIGNYAFAGTGITSVTVPASVTTLGTYAFAYCKSLTSAVYNSAVDVGNYTFANSTLKQITIGNGVQSIGEHAFEACTKLDTVTFQDNSKLTWVKSYAFKGCTALTSISLPATVEYLGGKTSAPTISTSSYVFQGCTKLASFTIPSKVTYIGQYMFDGCTSLTSIEIPEGVTLVANYAFQNTGLISVTLPSTVAYTVGDENTAHVSSIGAHAFENCTALETVTLLGTSPLSQNAFKGCTSLKTVNFNNEISAIGTGAFYGCTGLETITLPSSLIKLGSLNALIKVGSTTPFSASTDGQVFYGCTSLKSIAFPSGITFIPKNTFNGCTALETVTLNNVTEIGQDAFKGCTNENFCFEAGENGKADVENGAVYSGDTLVLFKSNTTSLTVRDGIKEIASYAFDGNTTLQSITLPSSLTTINTYAFRNCTSLQGIDLNQVKTVGNYAFQGCTALATVDLGALETIGTNVFENCAAIRTIGMSNVKTIGSSAFKNAMKLNSGEVALMELTFSSVTSIGTSAFENCTAIKSLSFAGSTPRTEVLLSASAFKGCSSLASLDLSNVTRINVSVFQNCTSLTSVEVPASVTNMAGTSIFQGCTSLKTATLNISTSKISDAGNSWFEGCTALETVNLGSNVKALANKAFYGCTSLKTITLPEGFTLLGGDGTSGSYGQVFAGCSSLEQMIIPEGVTYISYRTFYNCTSLTSIVIPSTVTKINNEAFTGCTNLVNVYNLSNVALTASMGVSSTATVYEKSGLTVTTEGYVFYTQEDGVMLVGYFGKETKLVLPEKFNDKTYEIAANAFIDYTYIESVTVGSGVTAVGANAFKGWTEKQTISLPFASAEEIPETWNEGWLGGSAATVVYKTSDEDLGEDSGENSGENSGEDSGENSGENSGEDSGENSGENSGEDSGEDAQG